MKFGVCAGLDLATVILAAGFDYVEVSASEFAAAETFDVARYRAASAKTSNLFFPGGFRLVPELRDEIHAYSQRAIRRAAEIGIEVMVVGSGGQRSAAPGTDVATAEAFFVEIVAEMQTLAGMHGILLAPESLNRRESNVGNDLASFTVALQARGVGYTADSYHVLVENDIDRPGQPVDWEREITFRPTHVHVADLPRDWPKANDPEMQAFAARLKGLCYDGRISLECRRENDEPATFAEMRSHLERLFA